MCYKVLATATKVYKWLRPYLSSYINDVIKYIFNLGLRSNFYGLSTLKFTWRETWQLSANFTTGETCSAFAKPVCINWYCLLPILNFCTFGSQAQLFGIIISCCEDDTNCTFVEPRYIKSWLHFTRLWKRAVALRLFLSDPWLKLSLHQEERVYTARETTQGLV